jgi:hypothetical protein
MQMNIQCIGKTLTRPTKYKGRHPMSRVPAAFEAMKALTQSSVMAKGKVAQEARSWRNGMTIVLVKARARGHPAGFGFPAAR